MASKLTNFFGINNGLLLFKCQYIWVDSISLLVGNNPWHKGEDELMIVITKTYQCNQTHLLLIVIYTVRHNFTSTYLRVSNDIRAAIQLFLSSALFATNTIVGWSRTCNSKACFTSVGWEETETLH